MGVNKSFSFLDLWVRGENVCQATARIFKEVMQANNNEGQNEDAALFGPSVSHQHEKLPILLSIP